jgi:pyruvate dehydrogenase E2 component (dihydrolipoamide acetyltransferase)
MSDVTTGSSAGAEATPPAERIVSPEVRRLAAERGIPEASLATLDGSGRGGRLLASDLGRVVPAAAARAEHGAGPGGTAPSREELAGDMATRVAPDGSVTVALDAARLERTRSALVDASSGAPVTSAMELDLTRPVRRLVPEGSAAQGDELRVRLLPVLVRHLAAALLRHPVMHASLDLGREAIVHRQSVDLRLTVGSGRSQATVLLPDVTALPDDDLRMRISAARRLAAAALPVDDRSPAGLWVIERASPCAIFETPPLAAGISATLTLGLIERRPLSDAASSLRIGWAAYLCCTYDHRLIDGADAARFLGDLAATIAADG